MSTKQCSVIEVMQSQDRDTHLQNLQDRKEIFLQPIFEVPEHEMPICDIRV